MNDATDPPPALILYQTEDGRTRIECRLDNDTLWLTQKQIAELFQKDVRTINEHLRNIFEEGELVEESVVRKFRITANDGKKYENYHYSLPAILAVGYRVRSHRGTQFRQWATARLADYLVRGFVLDDERLKNPPGPGQKDYFDELLDRIRDIRASERRFYQKILDIYATSVDYAPDTEMSQRFFATVQNKMHWAAHGHTAAEIIHARANADKPAMGVTSPRPGGIVRKDDVASAKNYLSGDELEALNRIVAAYLEFAELQALNRKPMTMGDWIAKLDDFLTLSGRALLDHAGRISAEDAKAKAEREYEKYRQRLDAAPRRVDADFDAAVQRIETQGAGKKTSRKNPGSGGKR